MRVSVADAKNRLTRLIQEVERGERVTIRRHGVPVVDIVRTTDEARQPPKFGTLKGKARILDERALRPMTETEADAFYQGNTI